ncbi:MAG: hypothetical protein Q8L87_13950 [Anaerolineales bacterium]|nr:hypothetical protein [Anaerolineales bacterium]
MKRIASLLFAMIIFLSACASPATSTSLPTEQAGSASTFQPVEEVVPVENTETATPVPSSPHWYWAVDLDAAKLVAVNQFGERREIGALDPSENENTSYLSIDDERALLFMDSNNDLRLYLLTPDAMQKIALPSDPFYFNTESWQSSRAIIAAYEDHVLFSYVTDGSSHILPDRGPIFLVDLTALTAKLIDESVTRGSYSDSRAWVHASPDGRYLRYLNGDRAKMDIRELDMVTGEARTLFTTTGSSYFIYASPQGDMWYLYYANLIQDLDGNQKDLTDESLTFRPLRDGKGIVYPLDCVDDCEIKLISPFGNEAELTYHFPWTIEFGTFYRDVGQWLPDQSLLLAGKPYAGLSDTPAIVETYPDLAGDDIPLFRLTPDGQARLVGIYTRNVSDDGRYMLLRSADQTSFFVYDAVADRPLFDMPVDPGLEEFLPPTVKFLDTGILVNLTASVSGDKDAYRSFYSVYSHKTFAAQTWEDVNLEYSDSCPDLLEDGSVVCWLYRTDADYNFDLVRYDPATGTKTTLLENVWLIDFTP